MYEAGTDNQGNTVYKFFNYVMDIDHPEQIDTLTIDAYTQQYKTITRYKQVGESQEAVQTYVAYYEKSTYQCAPGHYEWDPSTMQQIGETEFDGVILPSVDVYQEMFDKDTAEYRLTKFKKEFNEHLNLSYCLLYYILTNVLIMFDSRAKNMMIASWGPETPGGEYIWYPIFYDMDTQLGVNNSGVVYWDYHNDPEDQGLFSGASSVLWTNINAVFQKEAQECYQIMRERGYLSEAYLRSYYDINLCNKWSELMKNADAFYKYIAPCLSVRDGYGYMNKEGEMVGDDFTYLYCLQGDRTLNRDAFFVNRLNYKDSEWFAGVYNTNSGQGGNAVQIRYNANTTEGTSDPTLGQPALQPGDPGYELESDLNFNVSTYLTQFCTVFYDEVPVRPSLKYDANDVQPYVTIPPLPAVATAIQNGVELPQQLIYFYGPKYIRSFGDLSTKYPDELFLQHATRIRDLRIGNDNPDYRNERLVRPEALGVASSANDANAKTLLQYVDVSNLRLISGSVDISGCIKLQTFKALGTQLAQVSLPAGAVYKTIYLPSATTSLILRQPLELSRVLHTKEPATYAARMRNDGEEIEGLYIEDVTDKITLSDAGVYGLIAAGAEPKMQTLVVDKTKLGYEDYMIFKFIMGELASRYDAGTLSSSSRNLVMAAQNINWTPYRKLETDDDSGNYRTQYYTLTDYGTYAEYTWVDKTTWLRDLVIKGLYVKEDPIVYEPIPLNSTYDPNQEYYNLINGEYVLATNVSAANIGSQIWYKQIVTQNPITTLQSSIFPWLLREVGGPILFKDAVNQAVGSTSSPVISGRIHFHNAGLSAPLSEYYVYSQINSVWPNLEVTADEVTQCRRTKFVEIDPDGATIVYTAQKAEADDMSTNVLTPVYSEDLEAPQRQHYDFLGWSSDPSLVGTKGVVVNPGDVVLAFDAQGRYVKTDENDTATGIKMHDSAEAYYAVFCLHKYRVDFVMNPTWTETLWITSGDTVHLPDASPYYPAEGLGLNYFWHFRGYGRYEEASTIIDEAIILRTIVHSNLTFYAKYEEKNVYDYPIDARYLNVQLSGLVLDNGESAGLRVSVKPSARLKGKICFPKNLMYNNKSYPVIQIGSPNPVPTFDGEKYPLGSNGLAANQDITHIFFEGAKDGTAVIQNILQNACAYMFNLVHVDFPASLKSIDRNAFVFCHNLVCTEINAEQIADNAFNSTNLYGVGQSLTINGQINYLGVSAFLEAGYKIINIGTANKKAVFSTAASGGGYASLGNGGAVFGSNGDRYDWSSGLPEGVSNPIVTDTINFYTTSFQSPSQIGYILVGATNPQISVL